MPTDFPRPRYDTHIPCPRRTLASPPASRSRESRAAAALTHARQQTQGYRGTRRHGTMLDVPAATCRFQSTRHVLQRRLQRTLPSQYPTRRHRHQRPRCAPSMTQTCCSSSAWACEGRETLGHRHCSLHRRWPHLTRRHRQRVGPLTCQSTAQHTHACADCVHRRGNIT